MLAAIPLYVVIGFLVRPPLREQVKEKFNRGAASQQFLVETIVGMQTVKARRSSRSCARNGRRSSRLTSGPASRRRCSARAASNAIQYVSKLTTAPLLLFGAKAVIDGDLTVGALVAFNMIAAQAVQPILRLSQLWQDFQQVQISVERLGDILNMPPERIEPIGAVAADAARRDRISATSPSATGRAARKS